MSVAAVGARVWSAGAVLADPTDVGDETHKGGPFAILVIAVLCIVCFFLFRSMSKHLRRVRDDFPDAGGPAADAGPADTPAETDDDAATPAPTPGSVRPAPGSHTRTDHPADR